MERKNIVVSILLIYIFTQGISQRIIKVVEADINKDGYLNEYVILEEVNETARLLIYENNTVLWVYYDFVEISFNGLEVIDFDNDGYRNEIVCFGQHLVTIVKNKEIIEHFYVEAGPIGYYEIADFERDNKPSELVITHPLGLEVRNRTGIVWKHELPQSDVRTIHYLEIGDFDGNGYKDEVLIGKYGNSTVLFDRNGTILIEQVFNKEITAFHTGDIDRDGNVETIIGCEDGSIEVYHSKKLLWDASTFGRINSIKLANIDDDNDTEIIVGSLDYHVWIFNSSGGVEDKIPMGKEVMGVDLVKKGTDTIIVANLQDTVASVNLTDKTVKKSPVIGTVEEVFITHEGKILYSTENELILQDTSLELAETYKSGAKLVSVPRGPKSQWKTEEREIKGPTVPTEEVEAKLPTQKNETENRTGQGRVVVRGVGPTGPPRKVHKFPFELVFISVALAFLVLSGIIYFFQWKKKEKEAIEIEE